jgi:hypothetical protein
MRALIAITALSGCASGALAPPDGGAVDAAGGIWLHARWSVVYQGQPSSCSNAGIDQVALRSGKGRPIDGGSSEKILASFDCSLLEGTAGPFTSWGDLFSQGSFFGLSALDAHGTPIAIHFGDYTVFEATCGHPDAWTGPTSGCPPDTDHAPGTYDLPPVIFYVTDEPIPEMRRIFEGARAYYKAHGALPPSSGFTPPGGACCGQLYEGVSDICDPRPSLQLWTSPPWSDLGFEFASPFFYSYSFTSSAAPPSFAITATADFDCDGVWSRYEIDGALTPAGDFTGIDNVHITLPGD